ncbi:MAG: hypothetical protein Fur0016_23890 [Anaerolineales bacterium]
MNPGFAPILFGLAAALTGGAGDFSGGLAAKRTKALSVVVLAQAFSVVLLLAAIVLITV